MSEALAPWSIQRLTSPSSSGFRSEACTLLAGGGMMVSSSRCEAAFNNRLDLLCLGVAAGPESPPLRMSSGVSRISRALAVVLLWQARQFFFNMGRTSRSKSTAVERLIFAMGMGLEWLSGALVSARMRFELTRRINVSRRRNPILEGGGSECRVEEMSLLF